jgi:P-type Ca2+ transporter type 2C
VIGMCTAMILLPLHIVFLEMIVDPACSFVFEREPPAEDIMRRPPRAPDARMIDAGTFAVSIGRGLLAFAAVLTVYLTAGRADLTGAQQAALAFTALVIGNLTLIVSYRSGGSLWQALGQPNPAFATVASFTLALLAAITLLPGPGAWFGFAPPPLPWLMLAAGTPVAVLLVADLVARRFAPGI